MRDINEINPYIRLTMDGAIPAGWVIPNRIIYDYEIIYIAKESVTITCDGHDYLFKEGDFVFLRPGITHKFHNIKKDVWQPHIHFDFFYNFDSSKIPVSFKDIDEFNGMCFCLFEFFTAVINCLSMHIFAKVLKEFCFSILNDFTAL